MKKILITGGNGEFCKHLVELGKEHSFFTPVKSELDVRSYWGIDQYFYRYHTNFDYVIHAGAITRPMVIHEDNPRLSIHTNIIGTANVVLACERYNISSSNYISVYTQSRIIFMNNHWSCNCTSMNYIIKISVISVKILIYSPIRSYI
jgi:dTDP-4-dehydrorhamnose reductase